MLQNVRIVAREGEGERGVGVVRAKIIVEVTTSGKIKRILLSSTQHSPVINFTVSCMWFGMSELPMFGMQCFGVCWF